LENIQNRKPVLFFEGGDDMNEREIYSSEATDQTDSIDAVTAKRMQNDANSHPLMRSSVVRSSFATDPVRGTGSRGNGKTPTRFYGKK
jgi:hypothetical protein